MQTERVTFLTTPDHKAALDRYAAQAGKSVGHVLREASVRYLADAREEQDQLAVLVEEANIAIPKMQASLDHMIRSLADTHAAVDRALREAGIRT